MSYASGLRCPAALHGNKACPGETIAIAIGGLGGWTMSAWAGGWNDFVLSSLLPDFELTGLCGRAGKHLGFPAAIAKNRQTLAAELIRQEKGIGYIGFGGRRR